MAAPPQTSTRPGRSMRFPRRFDNHLPTARALAHIPSKENENSLQAVADEISHPSSLGDPSPATTSVDENCGSRVACDKSPLDGSAPVMTNADRFGVHCVFDRRPLYDPLQSRYWDVHSLEPTDPSSDCRPGASPNQSPPHPDMQTTPYYHPFSNPSAAAMMVAYHLGNHVQPAQRVTQFARILGSMGSDLNPLDLSDFDGFLEQKKLDTYLATAPENAFRCEDGCLESSDRIRPPLIDWDRFYVNS